MSTNSENLVKIGSMNSEITGCQLWPNRALWKLTLFCL